MTNLLTKYKVKGAQLALTYKGRLVYNRGFGYANTATSTLVQKIKPNHITKGTYSLLLKSNNFNTSKVITFK